LALMDASERAAPPADIVAGRLSIDGRIKDVRADHVASYRWAASRVAGHVVDAGCNSGYGAAILADAGHLVTALDRWQPGLDFAERNWRRPGIVWANADFAAADTMLPVCDAVVAFEVLEHLDRPELLLRAARAAAPVLLASAPNEAVWPHQPRYAPEHKRHYTRAAFETLLRAAGWSVVERFGQADGRAPVLPGVEGRTLVAACR
jgi:2-polyprenyl-3-methyl-5-hydroxy-6-metoxy-1,4-benzoquinol methylase